MIVLLLHFLLVHSVCYFANVSQWRGSRARHLTESVKCPAWLPLHCRLYDQSRCWVYTHSGVMVLRCLQVFYLDRADLKSHHLPPSMSNTPKLSWFVEALYDSTWFARYISTRFRTESHLTNQLPAWWIDNRGNDLCWFDQIDLNRQHFQPPCIAHQKSRSVK